ncbi:MAG: hypothetical protein IPK23_05815 [Rhizobiales bacterium]|jgi:hypothetical protein|nr:hypothetical protein [Hyphomicrobiales bacterium]
MADDENPLEGAEFEAALGKLHAGSADPKALATVLEALRDAVLDLQEQVYSGEDDDEDDDDK